MDGNQGYFSLIQYSEVPERAEYVNIGLVVFVDKPPYVLSKFSQRPRRVQAAFNVHLGAHFELLQQSARERLKTEFGGGWKKERIQNFISLQSGKVRFSPLRSLLLREDPTALLDDLFAKLVGEIQPISRRQRPSTKLAQTFRLMGVDSLLVVRPEPVRLAGGIKIEAPFAYQNGAFNLIEAISLAGDPDKAFSRATPHMIEGRLLSQETALVNPKRLVVIADEAEGHDASFIQMVSSQMEEHSVRFYTMGNIEPLVKDIRTNYALHH